MRCSVTAIVQGLTTGPDKMHGTLLVNIISFFDQAVNNSKNEEALLSFGWKAKFHEIEKLHSHLCLLSGVLSQGKSSLENSHRRKTFTAYLLRRRLLLV